MKREEEKTKLEYVHNLFLIKKFILTHDMQYAYSKFGSGKLKGYCAYGLHCLSIYYPVNARTLESIDTIILDHHEK